MGVSCAIWMQGTVLTHFADTMSPASAARAFPMGLRAIAREQRPAPPCPSPVPRHGCACAGRHHPRRLSCAPPAGTAPPSVIRTRVTARVRIRARLAGPVALPVRGSRARRRPSGSRGRIRRATASWLGMPGARVRKRRTTGSFERPDTALSGPVGPPQRMPGRAIISIAFQSWRVAVRLRGSRAPSTRGAGFGRERPQGVVVPENPLREDKIQAKISQVR